MRKTLSSICALILFCTLSFSQSINLHERAYNCLDQIAGSFAESLPMTQGIIRYEAIEVNDSRIIYYCTINDLKAYQSSAANQNIYKQSIIDGYKSAINENGFILSLLADMNMGIEYVYSNPSNDSQFIVSIPCNEIKEMLGPLSKTTRERLSKGYFDSSIKTSLPNDIRIDISNNTMHFSQPMDCKSTDAPSKVDKAFYSQIIKDSYLHHEPGTIFYNICLYAEMDFHGMLRFSDKTLGATVTYKDIVKAYLSAKSSLSTTENVPPSMDNKKSNNKSDLIEEPVDDEVIPFALVDKKPSFKGGDSSEFSLWVNSQLVYPEIAKNNGVQGRVTLQFTVEIDGSVSNIKVLRGVDPSLDQEAVRVVKASPKWTPGKMDGKLVRVTFTFPVIFQLK